MMQPTPNETRTHTDELVDIREVSVDKKIFPRKNALPPLSARSKILTASAAAISW